ncbi:MAG: T9SS type A sorting domain-containing protein [Bacteroidetes bacterium]|nr:T9SS type A sorting domain-containing protein [Bacteroidota bacterium]
MKRFYQFLFVGVFVWAANSNAQINITSTTPANNSTNIPLKTTISITFSAALDTSIHVDEKELPMLILTNVDSVDSVTWSNGLKTLNAFAVLEPNTSYTIGIVSAVGQGGLKLPSPYIFNFTTGTQFPPYSVSGVVSSGTTGVSPDGAIVGLSTMPIFGHEGTPPFVSLAVTNASGNFSLPHVANGTYYPVAAKDVDGDGQIDPMKGGDVVAFGDSIVVNNANVGGVSLTWFTVKWISSVEAIQIADSLTKQLPTDKKIRLVGANNADTTGHSIGWYIFYTSDSAKAGYEVSASSFGGIFPMDSSMYYWATRLMAFGPDTAASADSFVTKLENAGGRDFRQKNTASGDSVTLQLSLGQLKHTQFGDIAPDTGLYWGAEYLASNPARMPSIIRFIGDFKTGNILVVTGVSEKPPATAKNYELYQNYPNPFNPVTIISFSVPQKVHVSLKVYNVLGQEVAILFDGIAESGRHEFRFDGSRLSSGIYFYKMQANDFMLVRKMLLLK